MATLERVACPPVFVITPAAATIPLGGLGPEPTAGSPLPVIMMLPPVIVAEVPRLANKPANLGNTAMMVTFVKSARVPGTF